MGLTRKILTFPGNVLVLKKRWQITMWMWIDSLFFCVILSVSFLVHVCVFVRLCFVSFVCFKSSILSHTFFYHIGKKGRTNLSFQFFSISQLPIRIRGTVNRHHQDQSQRLRKEKKKWKIIHHFGFYLLVN